MKVLVTGGAGFIGSHVVELLLAHNFDVCVVDDLSRGAAHNLPKSVVLHVISINSPQLDAIVERMAPDVVVHLAAQINVRTSQKDPVGDAQTNLMGTVRLLNAASNAGCRTLIFASSGGALYGDDAPRPTPEQAPTEPTSPYGAAKLAAETYLEAFCRQRNMRSVSLRLGNVYGPRQNTQGEAGVVALFAEAIAEQRALTIFGDGNQSRDYVFVTDVAKAIVAAITCDQATGPINLGTGQATSVVELAKAIQAELGETVTLNHDDAKAGEVRHSCLDVSRAQQMLGWSAQVLLADGLTQTLARPTKSKKVPTRRHLKLVYQQSPEA